MKYKIIIAYDGTQYSGWQYQPDLPSIAGTLQKIFKQVFHQDITIRGVSRTDAGVHASGQVAVFTTDLALDAQKMKSAWSNRLPKDIFICDLQQVSDDFNPHVHVQEKIYYYYYFQKRPLPQAARYGWYYHHPVDIKKLQECLNLFIGTHDFRSFCSGYDRESTIRTITSASVEYIADTDRYRIIIKGPGFLRYMIRRIVGACLEVASRDTVDITRLQTALDEKNPHQLLPTAPAHGLELHCIIYNQEHIS